MRTAAEGARATRRDAGCSRAALNGEPTYLYRYFNARGRLIYVGIAVDPVRRARRGHCWMLPQIAGVTLELFPDRESAHRAEEEAIRTEWPLYNDRHSPDRSWAWQRAQDARREWREQDGRFGRLLRLRGAAKVAHEARVWRQLHEMQAEEDRVRRLVVHALGDLAAAARPGPPGRNAEAAPARGRSQQAPAAAKRRDAAAIMPRGADRAGVPR